mmetsp:Transcript_40534/g.114652  ORF Transcript_40534/g.114652 Transcript_40534/m.114652 type:complete len:209 (+) Transcript_40534:110-736(+)
MPSCGACRRLARKCSSPVAWRFSCLGDFRPFALLASWKRYRRSWQWHSSGYFRDPRIRRLHLHGRRQDVERVPRGSAAARGGRCLLWHDGDHRPRGQQSDIAHRPCSMAPRPCIEPAGLAGLVVRSWARSRPLRRARAPSWLAHPWRPGAPRGRACQHQHEAGTLQLPAIDVGAKHAAADVQGSRHSLCSGRPCIREETRSGSGVVEP